MKNIFWIILLWTLFLFTVQYFVADKLLDGKLSAYVFSESATEIENRIEVVDQLLNLKDGKKGTFSYVVVVDSKLKDLNKVDFLIKDEVLNVTLDADSLNLKELTLLYEESIKNKLSTYDITVTGFYVTKWVII